VTTGYQLVLSCFAEGSVRTPPGTRSRRHLFSPFRNPCPPGRLSLCPSLRSPYPLSPAVSQVSSTDARNSFPLKNLRETGGISPQCSTWNVRPPPLHRRRTFPFSPIHSTQITCSQTPYFPHMRGRNVNSVFLDIYNVQGWGSPLNSPPKTRLGKPSPYKQDGSRCTGHEPRSPLLLFYGAVHSFTPSAIREGPGQPPTGRTANFNRKVSLLP